MRIQNIRVGDIGTSRLALYVVCAAIILGLRYKSVHEPLERDHATYAVIGHELLAGRQLYSDLWDNKPPGVFWTYAAAELVFGYGEVMVFALGLLVAVATVPAIERTASALDPKAGPWAAIFWSVTCNDLVIQANQPNAEVFMNLFSAWAFMLLVRRSGWRQVAVAGVLMALASVYKQVIVFIAIPLALVLALEARTWREAGASVAAFGLPGVLAWVAIANAFALVGSFDDFWLTVFIHSRHYSGNLFVNLAESVSWGRITAMINKPVLIPLALLAACGVSDFRRDGLGGLRLLLAAWLVGTHIAVAAPGRFYPHYDQLWLPPLAIGAGWGVVRLGKLLSWGGRAVVLAPGIVTLANLLAIEAPLATMNAEAYSNFKYETVFINVRVLGGNLGRQLDSDESFYVWGAEPGLYFYSKKHPVTGVLWDDPLYESVIASDLSARTLTVLERNHPELVVAYTTDRNASVKHPILDWIARDYRRLPRTLRTGRHDPEFFVRKGGRLERRAPNLTWEDVMNGRVEHHDTTISGDTNNVW